MQEARNDCFGLKKHSSTLLQAKTGKHECRNVTATYFAVTFTINKAYNFYLIIFVKWVKLCKKLDFRKLNTELERKVRINAVDFKLC